MDWTPIVVAVIGSGTLGALINQFFSRRDRLKKLEERLTALEIVVARIQLCMLIDITPKDHSTIIYELEVYFLQLHGDSWMLNKAKKWAEQEGVDISYILNANTKYKESEKK